MCSPQWPAGVVNWRGGPHQSSEKPGSEKPSSEKQGMAHTSTSTTSQKKSTQENAPEPACHSYAKTVRTVLTLLRSVPVSGEVLRRNGRFAGGWSRPGGVRGARVTTCGGGR